MLLKCLVNINTIDGPGSVEVKTMSLHQLALLMPAYVVSYEVHSYQELAEDQGIADSDMFDQLLEAINAIRFRLNFF